MKKLYFMRHGLSVMNKLVIFSGRTDTPLAPEGITQCHEAGVTLRDAGIDLIVSSPITRAVESAKIVAEEVGIDPENILIHDAFMERDFGPLEGEPYTNQLNLDVIDGVEHSDELLARAKEGWEYLQTLEANTILVVSHGAVGRALRTYAQPNTPFESEPFGNAQVQRLL